MTSNEVTFTNAINGKRKQIIERLTINEKLLNLLQQSRKIRLTSIEKYKLLTNYDWHAQGCELLRIIRMREINQNISLLAEMFDILLTVGEFDIIRIISELPRE